MQIASNIGREGFSAVHIVAEEHLHSILKKKVLMILPILKENGLSIWFVEEVLKILHC